MNHISRCGKSWIDAPSDVLERWHDNRSDGACNSSSTPGPQRAMEKLAAMSAVAPGGNAGESAKRQRY